MSSRSSRRRKKERKMMHKQELSDEQMFRILIRDPHFGPRMKKTRDGLVIAYILREGRAKMKKIEQESDLELRSAYGYPYHNFGE